MKFKPTREDGRSYRDVAVHTFKDLPPDTVVTYEDLGKALLLDHTTERNKMQDGVRRANTVLLKRHSRGVSNVPNVGYRVLPAREHMVAASAHQTKSDKAMGRALVFFDGANLSEMTEPERKLHQGQHMIAQAIAATHSYNKRRFDRIEEILSEKNSHSKY